MKHIKYFEDTNNLNQEIEDNMNDYMLPLTDNGFSVYIYVQDDSIGCEIGKNRTNRSGELVPMKFEFGEVKEEVYGLINFLKHTYDIDISEIHIGNKVTTTVINNINTSKFFTHEVIALDTDIIYDICLYFNNNK